MPSPIDRGAFFGAAAQAMRRILVDHARGRSRQRRGSGRPVAGGDALGLIADPGQEGSPLDAVALDEALTRFALEHGQAARVVELRFFAGLNDQAIGECLGINERTVRRHWTFAKAWLAREMNPDDRAPLDRPGSSA
jgi:RNA polymerase sigma factor (TIGR02999 family)